MGDCTKAIEQALQVDLEEIARREAAYVEVERRQRLVAIAIGVRRVSCKWGQHEEGVRQRERLKNAAEARTREH